MRAHRTLTATTAVVTLAFLALLGTGTHTVTAGETLGGIAAQYGTTASALASANGITNPNRIHVGAQLAVPAAATTSAATSSYTVKAGDTLGNIASRSGTTIAAVVSLNGLKNQNMIRIGQVLKLPVAAAAAGPGSGSGSGSGPIVTPAGGATHHVVKSGDTIGGIATRYRISQAQLINANGLTNGRIYVGQRLLLVPESTPTPAPSAGTTHTVAPGETLSSIAKRYGTTSKAIQEANGITDPNRVVVGTKLTIPSASGGSATTLVCPIQGAMHHVNDWGFPRSGGRFHEGNDLFATRGTPAVAVVGGKVAQTVGVIGGKQVKLTGDDGVAYYYTHLDQFGAAGRVSAGQVIGYVGNSGNAAGSATHVHFEVHPGGGPAVNPFSRVDAVC